MVDGRGTLAVPRNQRKILQLRKVASGLTFADTGARGINSSLELLAGVQGPEKFAGVDFFMAG